MFWANYNNSLIDLKFVANIDIGWYWGKFPYRFPFTQGSLCHCASACWDTALMGTVEEIWPRLSPGTRASRSGWIFKPTDLYSFPSKWSTNYHFFNGLPSMFFYKRIVFNVLFCWMVFVLTHLQSFWIHTKCLTWLCLHPKWCIRRAKMCWWGFPQQVNQVWRDRKKNKSVVELGETGRNCWPSLNIMGLISSNAQNYIFYHMVGYCWEIPSSCSSCLDPNLRGNMDTPS